MWHFQWKKQLSNKQLFSSQTDKNSDTDINKEKKYPTYDLY